MIHQTITLATVQMSIFTNDRLTLISV